MRQRVWVGYFSEVLSVEIVFWIHTKNNDSTCHVLISCQNSAERYWFLMRRNFSPRVRMILLLSVFSRFTFRIISHSSHMDTSNTTEKLTCFATKTRDFELESMKFSKSLWLEIIQSICAHLHLYMSVCLSLCVFVIYSTYTYLICNFTKIIVFCSRHLDCEYAKFWLKHTQKISEAYSLIAICCCYDYYCCFIWVLSSKNYKWIVRKWETPAHFTSFCEWVCLCDSCEINY